MKKTLIALSILALSGQAMGKTDLKALNNELNIMSSILKTSLKQNQPRKGIRVSQVSHTYLANQGVLFQIGTSGRGFHFGFGDMPVPVAPVPPISVNLGDHDWEFEFNSEWEEMAEDAMEVAREALRENRHKLRDLQEREREYAWELREYERRKRDLEFARRNASGEDLKELNNEIKELEAELKGLQGKRSQTSQYMKELEQEQAAQTKKRQEAKAQEYKGFLAGFEASLGTVLCSYGAGLKSLPDEEHVTFVLPRFGGIEEDSAQQDRLYVFKNKDIQSCVKDKIKADKLLQNGQSYLF